MTLTRTGLMPQLLANARLAIRLIREPRVPRLIKTVPVAALLYVLSPLDFSPDLIPLLGQIDDLAIVLLGLEVFLRLCPLAATAFHRAAITRGQRYSPMTATDDVIDVEWRRE